MPRFRDGCVALDAAVGLATAGVTHGDFAPWNLLGPPLTLIDLESFLPRLLPMHDLCHFVMQSGIHLGVGNPLSVARCLTAPGGLGWRYLQRTGEDPADACVLVMDYLRRSTAEPHSSKASRFRQALADQIRTAGQFEAHDAERGAGS